MIETSLAAVLVVFLFMGSIASNGWEVESMRNRENWWWACVLMIEIILIENWYAKAVLGIILFGLFQIGRSWVILRMFVIPTTGVAAAYALVTPHMQPWMIIPMLW